MIGTGRSDGSFEQQIEHLRESTGMGIVVIYLCGTVLLTIRSQISQSEDFKAAWLYELAPINKPGEILSGSLRAIMVKFLLPITILLSLVLSIIWGVDLLDDLLFGMLTITNLDLLLSIGMSNELPFSTEIKPSLDALLAEQKLQDSLKSLPKLPATINSTMATLQATTGNTIISTTNATLQSEAPMRRRK
jgi:hypothetical protein